MLMRRRFLFSRISDIAGRGNNGESGPSVAFKVIAGKASALKESFGCKFRGRKEEVFI